ncbi:receptor protein-tyrosine kinase CEPR1-like [Chenopodium quinoa]|uniref:receptor protein-tyrosine kinase CEPR1-like n=1 Tax=Chenopodium quinoa TaxID=63459 RepID=UPI000B77C611|nr:receptor protein-tyrosine kinase CEPR1-like [Chenopodium quinoa]
MAFQSFCLSSFVLILSLLNSVHSTSNQQPQYFNLMKNSLSGGALSYWNVQDGKSYCNYTGITCNMQGQVTKINISGWSLKGSFPSNVCSYLPELRVLDISNNFIQGRFPDGIINCSLLEVLNMSSLYLSGKLPNFSRMKYLRALDLSYNLFDGDFPMSIMNLTNLEMINFNENNNLNRWELPENITRLTWLRSLVLSTSKLQGLILPSLGTMSSLVDLELSGNYLHGQIPPELGKLNNLKSLMLYYNELTGTIPEELGNLTKLTDLDMSVNKLTGRIPESICRLPKLRGLQIYNNSLTGEIPTALGDSKSLSFLSIYDNFLTGDVPKNLGKSSAMTLLDLSENQLSGKLPPEICKGGKLVYFLVLSNKFTGEIPETYEKCTSLVRFRVSNNQLKGSVPQGLFGLPHVAVIDLAFNQLTGPISPSIGNAKNLSEFFAQSNQISGALPPEISGAVSLVKIDLSNNLLSGPIPTEIGNLKKLNLLLLRSNKLNSSIPDSLSELKSLNLLDLSNNQLTGKLPRSLSEIIPNSVNFSNNNLHGPIPLSLIKEGLEDSFLGNPGLCVTTYTDTSDRSFQLCQQACTRKRVNLMWVIVASVILFLFGAILFFKRWLRKGKSLIGHDETMSSSFCSYDVKSFHRISFNQREILDAMVDENIVGHGGSGTVYRIGLSSGDIVAVKKLWSRKTKDKVPEDQLFPDKELETEVQTLGNIRHKNIVKLYCYLSSFDCSLLVYEYMPNGNLWDALHKGKIQLDWPTRHQIALGVAQGLAYLHHDLLPSIVHRDIKSSNILLDVDFQPKVADFGVAKVLQAKGGKDSSNTVIAGTYGYMDPDYANTSKATTKCDVYSFGVVLMELVTGKKPVEAEFGENKNIINWVTTKAETKEGAMEVLDKRVSGLFRDDMLQVICTAIRCTARAPAPRPTMNDIVQFLGEIDPCRFDSCKSTSKTKATLNSTKINKTFQL